MRGFFTLLLSLVVSSAIHAQFRESIDVKLVEIDVVVTDRDGKRVHGLKAEDFEVLEGRTRQTITNFTEFASSTDQSSPPTGTPADPRLAPRQPQSLLVLIDRLTREGNSRAREFENLDRLVANLMRDGDRTSVVFWTPGVERATPVIESTDRDAVRRALRVLAGSETNPGPGQLLSDQTELEQKFLEEANREEQWIDLEAHKRTTEFITGERELMTFRRKTRAMTRLIQAFGAGPGKKSLLYIAQEFAVPEAAGARLSALSALEDVAKTANASGVTLYASGHSSPSAMGPPDDPPGLRMRKIDAMQSLTLPTGGLHDFGPISVASVGARLTEDVSSYYSIAYQARNDGRDRQRRITVRTRNRDDRVRARESFIEKSKETLAREVLLTRLFGGEGANTLEFQIETGEIRQKGRNRWLLPIVVRIPTQQLEFAQEGSERIALVKVLIAAANGVAEVTPVTDDDLRIVAGKHDSSGSVKYSVEILYDTRGSEVSIGVLDRRTGRVGAKAIGNRRR